MSAPLSTAEPAATRRFPPVLRGILWMLLSVGSLAAVMVSVRVLKDDLHTFELLFLRAGVAFAIIIAIMARYGRIGMATNRPFMHLSRSVIHLTGQFCVFVAVIHLPLAEVTALEFTIPIFTALIAAVAIREKVGPARWAGMAIAFAGVLVIVRPGVEAVHFASLAALTGTFFFGSANVLAKVLRRTESANQVVFYMHLVQTGVALVPALYVWTTPSLWMLPWILLMGLGSLGSHYAVARAVALADVSVVAPMDFLRLPLVALVALLMWSEVLSIWTALGATMIVGATWWNAQRETRAARRAG
jgi:drug/metabolite transporter (DMT)-like permease